MYSYNKYTTLLYPCWYSKDVHRTKCQARTIARLTRSLYSTKMARIRCYTMLRTIVILSAKTYNIQQVRKRSVIGWVMGGGLTKSLLIGLAR